MSRVPESQFRAEMVREYQEWCDKTRHYEDKYSWYCLRWSLVALACILAPWILLALTVVLVVKLVCN